MFEQTTKSFQEEPFNFSSLVQDYDDEHGLVRDDEGTKLEPFNLKKEREDGYFDAEGNYVEYRQENDARVSEMLRRRMKCKPKPDPLKLEHSAARSLTSNGFRGLMTMERSALLPWLLFEKQDKCPATRSSCDLSVSRLARSCLFCRTRGWRA